MGLNMHLDTMLSEPPKVEITEAEYTPEEVYTNIDPQHVISSENFNPRTNTQDCGCEDTIAEYKQQMRLSVTKKVNPVDNNSFWTFYFNHFSFDNLNQFVNLMSLIKENDKVLIHSPAALHTDDAEVIVSAIAQCKSNDITLNSPYVLNSSAAYVLTAGNKIMHSFVNMIVIDLPSVGSGGKALDAKNGLQADIYRRQHILNDLMSYEFISESEMKHITECQGSIILYGEKLNRILENFNCRTQKQPK